MPDKEVKFCFGMSKMTVKDEVKNVEEYERLRFVEFLEFLGRAAHTKYVSEPDLPFEDRLNLLLDDIFPVFGLKRKDTKDVEEDDNTSEESVTIRKSDVGENDFPLTQLFILPPILALV